MYKKILDLHELEIDKLYRFEVLLHYTIAEENFPKDEVIGTLRHIASRPNIFSDYPRTYTLSIEEYDSGEIMNHSFVGKEDMSDTSLREELLITEHRYTL